MLSRLHQFFSWMQLSSEEAQKPNILAITPCYMDQLALRIASSRKHWELLICPTLRSGLYTLRKSSPSVIVYDLETRDSDWRKGVRLLLSNKRNACLIAVTKKLDDDMWQTAFECGLYDIHPKPLKDNTRLIESIMSAHKLIAAHELTFT